MKKPSVKINPSVKFLAKVRDREVYDWCEWSAHLGMVWGTKGGETTARRHVDGGYVRAPNRGPQIGKPTFYSLTEAGIEALRAAEGEDAP